MSSDGLRELQSKASNLAGFASADGEYGWAALAAIIAELIKILIPLLFPGEED